MALSQVTDHIWLGSIMSLRAERTLAAHNVHHVLSVLGPDLINLDQQGWRRLPLFQQTKSHLVVAVEDLDDVDIMAHFAETNAYIQQAVDAGEGVLVHCAAGISRSVTCVVAYLMRARKWPPDVALEFVRAKRALANPNDGFLEQLQVYYDCGFEISEHKKPYREWKLRRSGGGGVSANAAGAAAALAPVAPVFTPVEAPPLAVTWRHLAPALLRRAGRPADAAAREAARVYQVVLDDDAGAVFAATEPVADALRARAARPPAVRLVSAAGATRVDAAALQDVLQHVVTRMVSLRCKGCAATLASSASLARHAPGRGGACQHFFVEPVEWMRAELEQGGPEGRLACPRCAKKVGAYVWHGARCSCGTWVTPAIKLSKAKVDEMSSTARPLL